MMKAILSLEILLLSCAHLTHGQLSRLPEPSSEERADSTTNALTSGETEEYHMRMRLRQREHRLNMIRQQILDRLGWSEPPIINPETRKILSENPVIPLEREEFRGDNFIFEKQCFSAQCELPTGVDNNLWTQDTKDVRLFQELPEISSRKQLVSASLRLYIRYDAGAVHVGSASRLLISVYQFLRPLHYRRRGRLINRKRLIDARMVDRAGASWVILDVKDAVEDWLSGSRPNYGLAVVVKDETENEVNATNLFEAVDCSSPAYIGCREDEDIEQAGTIWTVGSYPYLQIETKERRRRRTTRSVHHTQSHHNVNYRIARRSIDSTDNELHNIF